MAVNPGSGSSHQQWLPVECTALGGRAPAVGVARWHLDRVEFNPRSKRFRVFGWLVAAEAGPAVHVIVGQAGKLSSGLPNVARMDVADKFRVGQSPMPGEPWCGFELDVPGNEGFDLGFERDGDVAWVRRCSVPPVDAAAAGMDGDGVDGGAGLDRLLWCAERHHGPGSAELVGSREPADSRKGRVHIHEIDLVQGDARRKVRLVEKRDASRHELALARRLLRTPAEDFAPVLAVADAAKEEAWFITGFVEPQLDMYLDPSPHVDALVSAVRTVDRVFGDLAGEACRPDVVRLFREAITRLKQTDERLGAQAGEALESAMPCLQTLPVVASHNDFYWNNLGLERREDGALRVRMFDLELLGPNLMGAEFHQFARMVMESDAFRAPFDAIVQAYADAAGVDARRVRLAALAFAMVRCGMRLHGGTPTRKRSDGSPRCEEPQAYAGLAQWLAAASRDLPG
ncbi:hypothetical protein [Alkalisalibacterium limincola]|uniref:Aminoglycoside phosphotransferase domain-containing protein n=1 Tax=Alkalisalibacterium limincola TaxID=2699169 RepID=A0A5C8KL34_9GAMM|nr:hypothetical protein [Alkalisalibacterium limincola]TXK59854.1 hypothetical protein FU658_12995 [Alkalisalibacterium limincola]